MDRFSQDALLAQVTLRVITEISARAVENLYAGRLKGNTEKISMNIPNNLPAYEFLTELASEMEIGSFATREDGESLVQNAAPKEEYVIADIRARSVETKTRDQLIADREFNMVGTVVFPKSEPTWVFCRPMSYPLEDAWILHFATNILSTDGA